MVASDPNAAEPSDDGEFTFTRTGPTTGPLTVNYTVTGSATGDADYTTLPGTVTIPIGQVSMTQPVAVIDDTEFESDETVIVTINTDPSYTTGVPNNATVTINDDEGIETLEMQVGASSDDAEEKSSGSMKLTSSDLELVVDKNAQQTVGVRFTGVTVPQGASIISAWIQFQTDETDSVLTDLTIRAQAADNPGTFIDNTGDITGRLPTTASATWSPSAWNIIGEAGPAQQTSDLSALIQEVIDRTGWIPGNAIVLIISGTGVRTAEAYDGLPNGAPLLHIEFATGSVPNRAPTAVDDTALAMEEIPVVIDVVDNDFDPDLNLDPTTANTTCSGCSVPGNGTLTNNSDGTFTYTPDAGSAGSDMFVYEVCDTDGLCDTATVTITINPAGFMMLEVRVGSSSDDAEEKSSGSMKLTSSDLELVVDKNAQQTVGVRFIGITIPQGASIISAWIQFQADETSSVLTDLTIRAQAADNPGTFTNNTGDITGRATTTASATWSPPAWNIIGEAGAAQQTPDIAALIQEVVDRPGWIGTNAIVLIISGTGVRTAEAYNGFPNGAPLLHIEYTIGS